MKEMMSGTEWYFYGIGGQKLLTKFCDGVHSCTTSYNVYFGGKLLKSNGAVVATDRLGSVRANDNGESFRYYPYGEERTSTADNREKFGTYMRDSLTQDYADQRYYGVGSGRFMTPDPSMDNVDYSDPTSWNAYAYVNGDPINFTDPDGTTACGDLINGATGTSVSSIMTTYNDLGYLAQTIWHEGGPSGRPTPQMLTIS